jgi:hypothetical protein
LQFYDSLMTARRRLAMVERIRQFLAISQEVFGMPAGSAGLVGRLVFAAVCDKLIDTDPNIRFVPQPAAAW